MKRFICLSILMIGFMVTLPSTSSGSGSPPGQPSFAVSQLTIDLPAMEANKVMTVNYEVTFEGFESFEMAVLPEKGGEVAVSFDQERTYLIENKGLTYKNKYCLISKNKYLLSPDFYVLSNLRTCSYELQSANRLSQDKDAACGQIKIRADSKI